MSLNPHSKKLSNKNEKHVCTSCLWTIRTEEEKGGKGKGVTQEAQLSKHSVEDGNSQSLGMR